VRSIAKRHGGRVFAESAGEDKGATFTLELPRMQDPA
jgi:signal transduction histidine kinase